MKTITINLYRFTELRDQTQAKVIGDLRLINVEGPWWQFIYEDAEQAGLIISGFDIDVDFYIKACFKADADTAAAAVIENHGTKTETYLTAQTYLRKVAAFPEEWPELSDAPEEYQLGRQAA